MDDKRYLKKFPGRKVPAGTKSAKKKPATKTKAPPKTSKSVAARNKKRDSSGKFVKK